MKGISLFSGGGGGDLGMESAGIETIAQVEIDYQAREVLAARWPNVPRWFDVQDILTTTPDQLCLDCEEEPYCRRHEMHYADCPCLGVGQSEAEVLWSADVLYGGFPCQDISAGRDRWGSEGLAGGRSGLWWEFHRIASVLQTKWMVVENVERLRTGRSGDDLRAVLEGLDGLGYVGFGVQLDAAAFGLPARRPRIYLVARRAEGSLSGLEQGQRLAARWSRYDPGRLVLEWPRQPRSANDGPARPVPGTYRKLSAVEMERALGWPDDHTRVMMPNGKRLAEGRRRRIVGNGMAVPAVAAIGRFIVDTESHA